MRVISSSELRNNLKKYLDLATEERIFIQRGKNETFVLTREQYLEPDNDLKRAVTLDELFERVKGNIHKMFADQHKQQA